MYQNSHNFHAKFKKTFFMTKFYDLKKLLLIALLGGATAVNGQVHPLSFGAVGGGTATNWYKDYVGLRFEVITPAVVAGDKQYTTANNGSGGTGQWGGAVTTPILNKPIIMAQETGGPDSLIVAPGVSIITNAASFPGKIAFVYRGGSVEFGYKALQCQMAGAIACVIVNNIPGGPVGMGAGASGPMVTIPVFMISKADGDLMDGQYNQGNIPTMTITPWGLNNKNDLGFVPDGIALWHNFAIPSNQLAATNPSPYKMVSGAFIANYGTSDAKNVKVTDTITFSALETGAPSVVHTGVSPTLATFTGLAHLPKPDSVYAMFNPTEYDLGAPGVGRYDIKYTISSDTADQYTGDNTATASFHLTDSVYSKGRYDFGATPRQPIRTLYEAFGGATNPEYLWGPMYYVAKGGATVSTVQYALSTSSTTSRELGAGSNNLYLFKWVDGSGGQPKDSVVEDGEMELVGSGYKAYTVGIDTSGALLTAKMSRDTIADGLGIAPYLADNTWYYLAVDVPSGGYFLGCDGIGDPLPRVYGRRYATNSILDYSSIVGETGGNYSGIYANPANPSFPCPAPGNIITIAAVDSFNYSNSKGLIPAVAMIVNNAPDTSHLHDAVNNVTASTSSITLSPNPAKDYLNVSFALDMPSATVKLTIIDGLARVVGREVLNNVQNQTYSVPTTNLPAGNYYIVINFNEKIMSKKFVVIK
jgi:hypothetical protein